MTLRELKGVIFDLDGVIVNTVDLHYHAWKQMFGEMGIAYDLTDRDRFRGVHQRQILLTKTHGHRLSETQITHYLDRKANHYRKLLAEAKDGILQTSVIALLQEARAQRLRVGLASSSTNARLVLEITGLRPLFDAVADGYTVCRNKPEPDIFVWVAGALGLNPEEVVVIEDGSAGVQGARTAGMFVVGLNVDGGHLNLTLDTLNFSTVCAAYTQLHPLPAGAGR